MNYIDPLNLLAEYRIASCYIANHLVALLRGLPGELSQPKLEKGIELLALAQDALSEEPQDRSKSVAANRLVTDSLDTEEDLEGQIGTLLVTLGNLRDGVSSNRQDVLAVKNIFFNINRIAEAEAAAVYMGDETATEYLYI